MFVAGSVGTVQVPDPGPARSFIVGNQGAMQVPFDGSTRGYFNRDPYANWDANKTSPSRKLRKGWSPLATPNRQFPVLGLEVDFRQQRSWARNASPTGKTIQDVIDEAVAKRPGKMSSAFSATSGGRALSAWRQTGMHKSGMTFLKGDLGIMKGGGVFRLLGPAFGALSVYYGYQEGGVGGAVKEGIKFGAMSYAVGAAWSVAAPLVKLGAVAGAGLGAAYLARGGSVADLSRPWVRDHARKSAALEMGTPIVDNYGTAATMRQRSLSAIQNSKLNGRTALGNEAALSYQPY